jgi:hypothetical protein
MVKHAPGRWLIILMACWVGATAGVARAQVNVTVSSSVAITVAAGSNISNAGGFTVTNTSGSNITISSINISATNAGIFSSLTLTGQVPGTAAVAASITSPTSSNSFDLSTLPVLPTGQAATFTLSGVASSSPVPTPTPVPAAGLHRHRAVYAGVMWPAPFSKSRTPAALLTVLALGMLIMTGRLRRRHLVVLAIGLIMAATEVGCGNTTTGTTGTSTQAVQTVSASSGGTPTGLPTNLGSITVQ